jgi:hypothetical protein
MSSYIFTLTFSDPNNTEVIEVLGTSVGSGKNNYSTSLDLVGSGYTNYGQDISQNFLKLLENFAGPNPPINSIKGQLWYDTSNPERSVLRVNNGSNTSNRWQPTNGVFQQAQDPSLSYSQNVKVGDLWVDTSSYQVKIRNQSSWITVGPNIEAGELKSGSETVRLQSNIDPNVTYPVILNWINGKVVEILAYNEFTPRTVIDGFSTIKPGTNLTRRIPARYNGVAESATSLYISPTLSIRATEVLKNKSLLTPQTHTGTFRVESSAGIQIRNADSGEQINVFSNAGGKVEYTNQTSNFTVGITNKSYIKFVGSLNTVGVNNPDPQSTFDVLGSGRFSNTLNLTTTSLALSVSGLSSFAKSVNINENLRVSGISTLTGKVVVGAAVGSGVIIEPAANDSYDLGSPIKAFRQIFVSKIGSPSSPITIYGAVTTSSQLEVGRNFSISGQVQTSSPVSFNGTSNVNLVTTATSQLITGQVLTTSTTATQTILVVDTSTVASGQLNKISKSDFLSDVYAQIFQTGMITAYGTSTLTTLMQNDWYICNGSSKNIITDSKLFTVIGYTYGGSGANFNLPNLTGVTSAAGGIPIHYIIKR